MRASARTVQFSWIDNFFFSYSAVRNGVHHVIEKLVETPFSINNLT